MEGKKAEVVEKFKREETCLMVILEEKHFSWCYYTEISKFYPC